MEGITRFSACARRRSRRFQGTFGLSTTVVLCLTTAALLVFAAEAEATGTTSTGPEVFEGVFHRPAGSKVALDWQAVSATDGGEWRIYRGDDLASFRLVDSSVVQRSRTSYRYESRRPLLDREYFQLRYCAADGSETVFATVLLVGSEFSNAMTALPDGPPSMIVSVGDRWDRPIPFPATQRGFRASERDDRPKPLVPPPRTAC